MSTIDVTAGETFSGTVNAGDTLVVEAGGQTLGATIYGGETVEAGGISSGDTVETGGFLQGDSATFPAEGVVNDVTIAGGTFSAAFAQTTGSINFTVPGGTLVAPPSTVPVTGFENGDAIEFPGASIFGPSLTVVGDVATVHSESGDMSVDIVGASDDNLMLIDKITIPNFTLGDIVTIVCFLAGTAIATPDGVRAIETLCAGDLVLTASGTSVPIRWLGRQTVAAAFADPLRVAPIRIREGALAENLPVSDLFISPDHALMVDGVFVQAGALVNGVSITREDAAMPERFTYFHVELSDHSLILAEGVPAETFIDNADRMNFDNWDEHAALDAETTPLREMQHPRAKSHRQVPQALRARLMARGVELYGSDVAEVG